MRRLVLIPTVLALLPGCPKTGPDRLAAAREKMREFKDKMCACKDKACANKVQDEMNAWAAEMTSRNEQPARPDERTMKEMQDIGTRYGECLAKAFGGETALPAPPPGPGTPLLADVLAKQTFDEAGTTAIVTLLRFSYVREDGVIDPTYGTAEVHLGKPTRKKAADDPNRPIGAPVPVDPAVLDDVLARCPVYEWKGGVRTAGEGSCMSIGELARPHCSVVEVWKQAIEEGAPAKGLAILELSASPAAGEPQSWTFTIDDEPRAIHFSKPVPDVCDPTLEKPVPIPPAPGKVQVKPNPY